MKIKSISVHQDDRLAYRATITWVRRNGSIFINDLEESISAPMNPSWTGNQALQNAIHSSLANAMLRQSGVKAKALGMQQEEYFSAVQEWDGSFILA